MKAREFVWQKSTHYEEGWDLDLGQGRLVTVERNFPGLVDRLRIRAGNLRLLVKSSVFHEISSPDGLIMVEHPFGFNPVPDPKIRLIFKGGVTLEVRVGHPHQVYQREQRLMKTFEAWRDADLSEGIEWITAVDSDEIPWPEAGIAAGFTICANRFIVPRRFPMVRAGRCGALRSYNPVGASGASGSAGRVEPTFKAPWQSLDLYAA